MVVDEWVAGGGGITVDNRRVSTPDEHEFVQRIGKVKDFTTSELKLFLIETITRDLRRKRS